MTKNLSTLSIEELNEIAEDNVEKAQILNDFFANLKQDEKIKEYTQISFDLLNFLDEVANLIDSGELSFQPNHDEIELEKGRD